jgi:hypothetical protein
LFLLVAIFFKVFRIGFWISSIVEKFKEKKPVQTQKKRNK